MTVQRHDPEYAFTPAERRIQVTGVFNLKPAAFGRPSDNYVTFAKNYGKQIQHWNGIDVTVNARPDPGMFLQGGQQRAYIV